MHELSIAQALLEQVMRHTPAGGVVRSIRLRCGPLRGIEPEAMQMGWTAVTAGTACQGTKLVMEFPRWQLECPECRKRWESEELYVECACGCATPHPMGGDELDLMSMDVDVPDGAAE